MFPVCVLQSHETTITKTASFYPTERLLYGLHRSVCVAVWAAFWGDHLGLWWEATCHFMRFYISICGIMCASKRCSVMCHINTHGWFKPPSLQCLTLIAVFRRSPYTKIHRIHQKLQDPFPHHISRHHGAAPVTEPHRPPTSLSLPSRCGARGGGRAQRVCVRVSARVGVLSVCQQWRLRDANTWGLQVGPRFHPSAGTNYSRLRRCRETRPRSRSSDSDKRLLSVREVRERERERDTRKEATQRVQLKILHRAPGLDFMLAAAEGSYHWLISESLHGDTDSICWREFNAAWISAVWMMTFHNPDVIWLSVHSDRSSTSLWGKERTRAPTDIRLRRLVFMAEIYLILRMTKINNCSGRIGEI